MKKIILSLIILTGVSLSVSASELLKIPYKNVKEEGKIKYENGVWSDNVSGKTNPYFIKFISEGSGNYSEFYSSDGQVAFNTGCQYEFIYKGDLIGYSNQDLKFYEFTPVDRSAKKRELTDDEVKEMFPDFRIVPLSEFSQNTNSYKLKKGKHNLKLILLNDTDQNFYHYNFYSNNAKFERYALNGFLNIKKKGMIHFSHFGENSATNPWFILLVRE